MADYPVHEHDVLVIGAGGAGLRAAIEASAAGVSVGLICKSLLGKLEYNCHKDATDDRHFPGDFCQGGRQKTIEDREDCCVQEDTRHQQQNRLPPRG